MPISTLTYRVKHLQTMAFSVPTVWNDYRSDTIAEVCRSYATRRRQFCTWRLKWRSRKRSLGWVSFKASSCRIAGDTLLFLERRYRFWLSRQLDGKPKTGSLTQDARGRWYVNVCCEVEVQLSNHNDANIGIDLGLKDQVICSDGMTYSRATLTRRYAAKLGMAQRARKKRQVAAICAKVRNTRKDWAHKVTTDLARGAKAVRVGHVSSSRLGKTRLAKLVYDAGWPQLRAVADRQSQ